jgi:NADPH:quinone reductase-like Zn-dependent oxidoreductase
MSDQPAPLISVFLKQPTSGAAERYDLPKTHRALVQKTYAGPMTVEEVPMPEVGPGSAILRIESASIISYQREVYNGTRKYPYPTPWTPGLHSVGRVVAAGPDAVAVEPGSLVYFDGFIRGRDDPAVAIISGLSDVGEPRAQKLLGGEWRNSTYAQYAKVPLENCFPLDEIRLCKPVSDGGLGYTFDQLAWIGMPLVGYGGLRRIEVQAGETVVIAPATGGFGGAATMAALAMGAKVIAM